MTGKERTLKAIRCEEVDRTPWVPFVGCHGGKLIDVPAQEYLRDADLIVRGAQKAIELYQPDGIPVMFDLQVEAETLGCELVWADDNPPAVTSHPLTEGVSLSDLSIPGPDAGRIATVLNATRRLREANPELAIYGLLTGPFTLALHLMGTEIFMRMFDDPSSVGEVMAFARDVAVAMSDHYVAAGCDVVAVVDPMTSQVGPDQFEQFVTPYAKPVFEHVRQRGAAGSFFVCGHAQQNIPVMCGCGPDNVSVDENIPLDYVRDTCLPLGVSFGGNMQLTTVLLLGSLDDAKRNAVECLEIGGEKGFILAPGCDLPYATPPENLQAVSKVVRDPYERDVAKALAKEETAEAVLDLSDYGQTDRVIVDVITLDSEACAPCQYMVEAVKRIAPEFEDIVEWREHKIKYREELVFMTSLMVRNVPTICIDGQIKFVSRIPARDELVAAIQQRIYEKLRMRVRRRPAELLILGDPSEQTDELEANARQAANELGLHIDVRRITDHQEIRSYGVVVKQAPATVLVNYKVKSTRMVPETAIIKEWLKDL